jgi:rhodanese-related sulfurtransferase
MKPTPTTRLACLCATAALLLGPSILQADRSGTGPTPVQSSALKVSAGELDDLVSSGKVLLVDVRPRENFDRAHLPGAVSVPLDELPSRVNELRASQQAIVTYCSGPRGENGLKAAISLREFGVKRVRALDGGFQSWVALGHVVEVEPSMAG